MIEKDEEQITQEKIIDKVLSSKELVTFQGVMLLLEVMGLNKRHFLLRMKRTSELWEVKFKEGEMGYENTVNVSYWRKKCLEMEKREDDLKLVMKAFLPQIDSV